jgi:hypothetical protein
LLLLAPSGGVSTKKVAFIGGSLWILDEIREKVERQNGVKLEWTSV